ncbi:MAG: nucleotidyltransferase family protein [bacterium]|nr:nucleotidyltransferase family protein [bacterium]
MDNLINKITPILQQNKVKKAAIFGSYARGDQNDQSDIDLLVKLPDELSLLDVIGIQQDIEDAVGRKVDLVEYEALKPAIRESILSQAQIIFTL